MNTTTRTADQIEAEARMIEEAAEAADKPETRAEMLDRAERLIETAKAQREAEARHRLDDIRQEAVSKIAAASGTARSFTTIQAWKSPHTEVWFAAIDVDGVTAPAGYGLTRRAAVLDALDAVEG